MALAAMLKGNRGGNRQVGAQAAFDALPTPIFAIDEKNRVTLVNPAAELFLKVSAGYLLGKTLDSQFPADSPLFSLIEQVRRSGAHVSEHELPVESPRIGRQVLNVHAVPSTERPGAIVIMLQARGIADMIDRQMTHRGAARSVTSMAAMLAHEVRNPLSGIRGAAQLLEQGLSDEDRPLAQLIREEADRISGLIERMEVFADFGPVDRQPVNIHKVLDRVQRLAETGFGSHIRFRSIFDPSLPPVPGNHDQLVQVFLNLVKNAAEACPRVGGEIILTTSYQHGVRFYVPGRQAKVALPLLVQVIDNGPGIPDDLGPHLFDAFVTTKKNGTGLGLALVAKLIDDHGGIVEYDSRPGRTEFRVMLPFYEGDAKSDLEKR